MKKSFPSSYRLLLFFSRNQENVTVHFQIEVLIAKKLNKNLLRVLPQIFTINLQQQTNKA